MIAATLAVFTALRSVAAQPSPRPRGVLFAPVLIWLSSAGPMFFLTQDALRKNEPFTSAIGPALALAIALPLSIASFRRALRTAGWTRWAHALRSFTAAAWLTLPVQLIVLLAINLDRGLLVGGYVLLVALLWLAGAAARRT